ncbi:MAG: energy transducer TonB [Telluria sp.]
MNFSHDKKAGRNWTGIAIVVVLHIIAGYGIATGLGKRMIAKMTQDVETKIIEDQKPPPPKEIPPPPPPPEMKAPPPPFIPPVEVNVQQPPAPSPIAQSTQTAPPVRDIRPAPPAAPASTGPKVANTPAVVDFNTCAKPEYPKNSQRNEETGTVVLRFLISAEGTVKQSQIEKSSGFRDLDRAAQSALGRCRFKPGIVDGHPQESWTSVQYVWTLD